MPYTIDGNSFTRRKTITINNNSGISLTAHQVPITVTYDSDMQTNFNDIRFTDSNNNLLSHWIESNTEPDILTGGTASADSISGAGYEASKAYDGNINTYWRNNANPNGAWWKYDLGAGITKVVTKLSIKETANAGYLWINFKLQGSNDNSNWTDIFTGTTQAIYTWQDFYFSNTIAYRYHRLLGTSGTHAASGTVIIDEIGLYSTKPSTTAKFWIKVNLPNYGTSPTGDNTVYMYYGNSSIPSTSNGDNTFIFFDDFIGSSLNVSKWGGNTEYANVSGSILTYDPPTNDEAIGLMSNSTFPTDSIFETYAYMTSNNNMIGFQDAISSTNRAVFYYSPTKYTLSKKTGTQSASATSFTVGQYVRYYIAWSSNVNFKYNSVLTDSSPMTTNVPTVNLKAYFHSSNPVMYVDWVFVRKYIPNESTAITVSTGTEETPSIIGATAMTISPSETPCITGICTVTVTVTWTNTGGTGTFTPSIIVDSTPYQLSQESLGTGASVSKTFTVSSLSPGSHSICPDPN